MKTRKHGYGKIKGAWCVYGLNGQVIAQNISSEKIAQELAAGRDMLLAQKRELRK